MRTLFSKFGKFEKKNSISNNSSKNGSSSSTKSTFDPSPRHCRTNTFLAALGIWDTTIFVKLTQPSLLRSASEKEVCLFSKMSLVNYFTTRSSTPRREDSGDINTILVYTFRTFNINARHVRRSPLALERLRRTIMITVEGLLLLLLL